MFSGHEPTYVCERKVTNINAFMKIFSSMIEREDNEIKINIKDVPWILQNKNTADFVDYGNIRNQIFQNQNLMAFAADSLYNSQRIERLPAVVGETRTEQNQVEYILTTYEDRIMLSGNGYPMYAGKNFYGCINYTIGQAYETRELISEGVPYLLQ